MTEKFNYCLKNMAFPDSLRGLQPLSPQPPTCKPMYAEKARYLQIDKPTYRSGLRESI